MTDVERAAKEQRRENRLRYAYGISACQLATTVCVILGVTVWSNTQTKIESVAIAKANGARAQCDAQYAQAASESFRAYLADLGQIGVITAQQVPGEGRSEAVAPLVVDLTKNLVQSAAAGAARAAYLNAGRPLPCPYPSLIPPLQGATP